MNNETKETLNNRLESTAVEEEIVLAAPTELFDEAKEISESTGLDEKFAFSLKYDANQEDFLTSMLNEVGAVVEDNNEDDCIISTKMNMTQLAFIKRLDCVERVKTDEGINPFLAEKAVETVSVSENDGIAVASETAASARSS